METQEKQPLKWPEGWERARIGDRKPHTAWKKNLATAKDGLYRELERMKAADVLLTHNLSMNERQDPGVAVYFSLEKGQDFSWQEALELHSPVPTLEEIDSAFRRKALLYHPDRPGGDAVTFDTYKKHYNQARAWVLGQERQEYEYVIPCDRFTEVRLNINAIRLAIAAMRQLDRVGVPGMLQRSFKGFRTALPAHQETVHA